MFTRLLPHFALLMAMLVWGTSYIALKIGLSAYSPTELMALRMSVAAAMFLPLAPQVLRALKKNRHWKTLAFMLLCEPCLYFLFETHALRHTSASQAGMIVAILPAAVTVAAWKVLHERVFPRTWIGFALAISGIVWLSMDAVRTENAPNPLLGNCLEGLAMLCATSYTVCLKKLTSVYSPLQMTAIQSTAGMVFFTFLMLSTPAEPPLSAGMNVPEWMPFWAIVYLGTCVTLGGYGLYNYGVSRISAGQASAYTNLIPVVTLILGVLFLHEVFIPAQYIASGMVIAGVLLSQSGRKK